MALPKEAPTPTTPEEARALLEARLKESKMTTTEFAHEVLTRDARVIRRWLSGDAPIPQRVITFLVKPRASRWPPRR